MNKSSKKEIIFIQPGYAHYREQLFKILSYRHNIHFVYEFSAKTYPGERGPLPESCTILDQKYRMKYVGLICTLLKYRPNIIISSTSTSFRSIVSFLYAALFRKQFILWSEEWRDRKYCSNRLRRFWRYIRNLVGVKIICCARSLVVGGSAAKNYALSLGKNERHVFTAINCANDLKLNQDFNDKKKTYRPGKYTFLYLSRIIPRKGLDILLKAFSLLRGERSDVFLLIAGDGPFRIFCENLTKSLQIPDVSFIGPVNQNSVIDYYQQADVFVLPSYYHEGLEEPWGLVINEAMSMNLPVITTTAVGAAYDIVIDDYNGFIAHENDVKSLYRVLDKILGMDLNRMGLNSRILFEKKNNFVHMANGFTSAIKHAKLK